jgi:hypothetical protein
MATVSGLQIVLQHCTVFILLSVLRLIMVVRTAFLAVVVLVLIIFS